MAENRDEALMLDTADEIPRGVVELFDVSRYWRFETR